GRGSDRRGRGHSRAATRAPQVGIRLRVCVVSEFSGRDGESRLGTYDVRLRGERSANGYVVRADIYGGKGPVGSGHQHRNVSILRESLEGDAAVVVHETCG